MQFFLLTPTSHLSAKIKYIFPKKKVQAGMAAKCRREDRENGWAGVRAWCWKSRSCGRNVGNAGHAAGRPPGLMARVQRQELLHPPWGRARELPPDTRLLLLQPSPARRCHGEPGKDVIPPGLTLCQEFGHAALVALLVFLVLAGQLLVCRFQPLWCKTINPN